MLVFNDFDMICFAALRDNIVVIHDQCSDILEEEKSIFAESDEKVHNQVHFPVSWDGRSSSNFSLSSIRSFDVESIWLKRHRNSGDTLASSVNLISLFDMMRRIALGNTEECIQVEAISVMNLILMRSNPYSEREKLVCFSHSHCTCPHKRYIFSFPNLVNSRLAQVWIDATV